MIKQQRDSKQVCLKAFTQPKLAVSDSHAKLLLKKTALFIAKGLCSYSVVKEPSFLESCNTRVPCTMYDNLFVFTYSRIVGERIPQSKRVLFSPDRWSDIAKQGQLYIIDVARGRQEYHTYSYRGTVLKICEAFCKTSLLNGVCRKKYQCSCLLITQTPL